MQAVIDVICAKDYLELFGQVEYIYDGHKITGNRIFKIWYYKENRAIIATIIDDEFCKKQKESNK